ncbi:apoptogenic protein 1, mitochondrial [Cimex lectularius]|uniref:APOPT family protein CG14806, mitochondrial n=1 Tax=Cimex lectularius TaxID=79782 RepID=A0A8I6RBC9_CIMLE|nr:apoptogenic protein 1, mitochondrial [Cimex lectularius]
MAVCKRLLVKRLPTKALAVRRVSSTQREKEGLMMMNQDLVGPPNPISNIRPITFHVPKNETTVEKELRLRRQKVQAWHEDFWTKHNTAFIKERKAFEESHSLKGASLGADEMSIFYKQFLDKYWHKHLAYNYEWYKHNFALLRLSFKVEVERFVSKLFNR